MAVLSAVAGRSEVSLSARAATNSVPPELLEAPGGLYPLTAKAFEMDEYRIMAGWPIQVPDYDIKVNSLVSASGELLRNREVATEIQTGALIRWVADPGLYDETANRWMPVTTEINPVAWECSVENAPTMITDYEYRVGDERFYANALNFDSDSANYLQASFAGTLTGSSGFTVIMVLSPNSAYGNNVDVPYNGLWCPQDKNGKYFNLEMQGRYLYLDTESQSRVRGPSINSSVLNNAPMYLAIVFNRPDTYFYVGEGPSSFRVQTVPAGEAGLPIDGEIYLGRSTEDLLHTADMALFDIGIYANQLSAFEVRDEFALLSRAYGGDS